MGARRTPIFGGLAKESLGIWGGGALVAGELLEGAVSVMSEGGIL